MAAANLTEDTLAFAGVKRNAKCAKGSKAFVFKKERCGLTFKCLPLGFNINFGQEILENKAYRFPAHSALMNVSIAQGSNGGRGWNDQNEELKGTADLHTAPRDGSTVPPLGPKETKEKY